MSDVFGMLIWMIHLGVTLFLVGLIWVIQIVHYPLFAKVGTEHFPRYEHSHTRTIRWIVGPAMLLELTSAVALLFVHPAGMNAYGPVFGLIGVVAIWLSTALIQIPCHERLQKHFEPEVHCQLVRSNWIRTSLWSLRGIWVLLQSAEFMSR